MTTPDIVILIVLLLFAALGMYWGLIRQVLALAGLILGVIVAGQFGSEVGAWLTSFVAEDRLAQVLGFLLTFLAVSMLASLLASLLRFFVGLLFLGWLDHLAGGLLGALQALFGASVILVAWAAADPGRAAELAGTPVAGPVLAFGRLFVPLLVLRDSIPIW
jgi:membrane protein required for colicin V production